jgi:hypothetical protein
MDSNSPDNAFLRAFEDCTLPSAEWRHRAHLKVAYLYLRDLPFGDALAKARTNIKRYNAATNTPEALERGYHETITVSWMRLVDFALRERGPAASANEFVEREAQFLSKEALLKLYSREQLISWRAKAEFVEPNLAPFPVTAKQGDTGETGPAGGHLIKGSQNSFLQRE